MFKAGDCVKCVNTGHNSNLTLDKIYFVVGKGEVDGFVTVISDAGEFSPYYSSRFQLYSNEKQFDLKKNPWFIRTGTKEKSEAVQKWLFEQGVEWYTGKGIKMSCEGYLTNTYVDGGISSYILYGDDSNPSAYAQEIIIEFETTVKSVTYPSIETESAKKEQDKKIKELKETIDKAQQQLEEMMSK